jgi:predicted  nucleic acid-binding Zn-ribbon protein
MHYALRLAEERERSAKENIDWLTRQFAAQYSSLEQRAKSAEKNAERAEVEAADAEDRVSKSQQALRVLRCRLSPYAPDSESKGAGSGRTRAKYSQASSKS